MPRHANFPRAFTLIELLVVIAIVAILAALLFPVFAGAKLAAKKTAALSNLKGIALGCALYGGDADEHYPLQQGWDPKYGWKGGWAVLTPNDWPSAYYDGGEVGQEYAWANSLAPYLKSTELLQASGEVVFDAVGVNEPSYATTRRVPRWSAYNYNGLLTEYDASAIASPSRLISFWQGWGRRSFRGFSLTNPALECVDPNIPCRYKPAKSGCDGIENGTWSFYRAWSSGWPHAAPEVSLWTYGRGTNVAMADGSAKFRPLGGNIEGMTDYRTDPYSNYTAAGIPREGWFESEFCHTLLFRPDFEFTDWGNPLLF